MAKNYIILFIALIATLFSCSENNYINIEEAPEIEFSSLNTINREKYSFTNKVSKQNVSIINSVEKTGFHFYNSFKFKTEDIGVLVGGTGLRARVTQDGGGSWQEFRFSKFANTFHSVAFSGHTIFIVGESKYIFKSKDLGKNWSVYNSEFLFEDKNSLSKTDFYKIRFLDHKIGFIAGERNNKPVILKTNNGGKSWEIFNNSEALKNSEAITDFHISSGEELSIVTSRGEYFVTKNGGSNWELILKTVALNSIAFKNANRGFVGGVNGTLLYTHNAGKNWNKIAVPENPNITDITFTNKKALITTSKSFSKNRAEFVYEIDENRKKVSPFLTKTDKDVLFIGDSYAIDALENNIFILDRNNLYKTSGK
ncbi:hypothetical protein GUB10_00345 [Salegentibacter sp. BLCTC]|uniref:WD40/YVTN/BNR-like repeat-containing protein n=1 Tax=Salegentibacter sp. BLCTC TaxID=2697368 RepID=UPI00187B7DA9|nr:YCF48-related protein [Salegentibacter sp. BLCTC]MBE7638770.1 hypothetical protein [Salegentibacter sp. BLCTC]